MWEGLHALELLSIEDNKLSTVQDGSFSILHHLHTLVLENNDLKTLSEKMWNSAGME